MGRNDVVFKVIIDKKESEIKLKDFGRDLTDLGNSLKAVGRNATFIFVGLAAALTGLIIPAALFEKKMLDVSKTTGLVGDELKALGQDLLTISKNSQLSAIALADIAATAGQLGIQGRQNILSFTKSVGEISQALGIQQDIVAKSLATIAAQFNVPIPEIQNLGSAINELSATSNASAEAIIAAMVRVGPALGKLRFSRKEIAGLVSTFITLTGSGERAGFALSRFFTQATKNFDELSRVFGISQEELRRLFDTDPTRFFLTIQKGLVGIESNSQRTALAMKLFGEQGFRASLGTAEGFELLTKNLKISRESFDENISITEELERVNTGFLAQLKIFRSEIIAQAIVLGDTLIPALKTLIGVARGGLAVFAKLPSPIKNLAVVSLVLTTVLAGLTAVIASVAGNILVFSGFILKSIPRIIGFVKMIRALTIAQTGLNLAFLANPIVLAITGIVIALGVLAFVFRDKFGEILETAKIFIDQMESIFIFFQKAIKSVINLDLSGLKKSFDEYKRITKSNLDKIGAIWREGPVGPTAPPAPGAPTITGAGVVPPINTSAIDLRNKEEIQKAEALKRERIRLAEETAAALLGIKENQNFSELLLQDQVIQQAREKELLALETKRQVLEERGLLDLELVASLEQQEQAIKEKFDRIEIERQRQVSNLKKGVLVNDLTTLKGFLGDVGVAFKEAAEFLKLIRLGEAIMNTANAITAALAGPFPANLANAAIVGAKGAAQIATINAQQFQVGAMEIPRTMPAILDQGEMVLTKSISEGIRGGELTLGGPGGRKQEESRSINMNFDFEGAQFIGITDDIVDQIEEKLIEKAETIGSALVTGQGF